MTPIAFAAAKELQLPEPWMYAADLAVQLRTRGVTARMYATTGPDRAVLALPQLTRPSPFPATSPAV